MNAFAFGHIAMIAIGTSIAVARVVAWILDWRAHTAISRIREQSFVAQVTAEVVRNGR